MPDKVIYVYRMEKPAIIPDTGFSEELKFEKWLPGFARLIPPNSPLSYLYLWMMHFFHIFKNRDYSAYCILEDGNKVCSMVCVPALYKWPFMNRNDLQIKNVFTLKEYRGKGYASRLFMHTLRDTEKEDRTYWYMTDKNNIPSQKLCRKLGFEYVGTYRRRRNRYFLYEGEIVRES